MKRKDPLRGLVQQFSVDQDFFFEDLLEDLDDDFFFGTLAPDLRASERPIAIACLRLVTFFPDRPLFNVPFLRSCIAL